MEKVAFVSILAMTMVVAFPVASRLPAASLLEVTVGIEYEQTSQGGRILKPTSTVSNLDWPVYVLMRFRDLIDGTNFSAHIIDSDGRPLAGFGWFSITSYAMFSVPFFIPLPGTPNDEKIGHWKIMIRLDGAVAREFILNVTQADQSILATIRTEAEARPNAFAPNYRLGVAASMFKDDQEAVEALKVADRLLASGNDLTVLGWSAPLQAFIALSLLEPRWPHAA